MKMIIRFIKYILNIVIQPNNYYYLKMEIILKYTWKTTSKNTIIIIIRT